MGCVSCGGGCSTGTTASGKTAGCGNHGSCTCNKMNTFDWLSNIDLPEMGEFDVIEVSFKAGAHKEFYINPPYGSIQTGDYVVVEAGVGYDVGKVSLKGELVRLQMKKKKVGLDQLLPSVIRRANDRDMDRLKEARALEKNTMVRARVISRSLGLDMKIGDVEYQGDKRKATFFYTADGRVDFRELIKLFAKEFRVKIEMRQIGARQESARIGGLGSCGRELCCSTWLTDFKSVSTAAARYQNLAINQSKLSGQCGRLKCCLNYELDTYLDALAEFPKRADSLKTEAGEAFLVKTDIFKGVMYYIYRGKKSAKFHAVHISRVKEIQALNAEGQKPMELNKNSYESLATDMSLPSDFVDVTGQIELAPLKKKRNRNRNRNRNRGGSKEERNTKDTTQRTKPSTSRSKGSSQNNNQKSNSKPKSKSKPKNTSKNNQGNNSKKNTPKNTSKKGEEVKKTTGEGKKPTGKKTNTRNNKDNNTTSGGAKKSNSRSRNNRNRNRRK